MAIVDSVKCRVSWCETRIVPDRLFCHFHWGLVPSDLQDRINHAWRERRAWGQSRERVREWKQAHTVAVREAMKLMPKKPRS